MLEFLHPESKTPLLTTSLPPADFAPSALQQKEYYDGANRWAGLILHAYQRSHAFSNLRQLQRRLGTRIGAHFRADTQEWLGIVELSSETIGVQGYHSLIGKQLAMQWRLTRNGYELSGLGEERMSYSPEDPVLPHVSTRPCAPVRYETPHMHPKDSSLAEQPRCGIAYDIALGSMATMVVQHGAELVTLTDESLR